MFPYCCHLMIKHLSYYSIQGLSFCNKSLQTTLQSLKNQGETSNIRSSASLACSATSRSTEI